jgi:hypothetical protein
MILLNECYGFNTEINCWYYACFLKGMNWNVSLRMWLRLVDATMAMTMSVHVPQPD